MLKITLFTLAISPALVFADCKAQLQTWASNLHPAMTFDADHAICKVNPANREQTLAALPFIEKIKDEGSENEYGLEVLIADKTNSIIAHHYQTAAILPDALEFQNLDLDTANYKLKSNLRAFALRITYTKSNPMLNLGTETLNMYALDGNNLQEVIKNLVTKNYYAETDDNCAGDYSSKNLILSMGEPIKNGYSSISVSQTTQDTHSHLSGNRCKNSAATPKTTKWTLEYNGTGYNIPKELSF